MEMEHRARKRFGQNFLHDVGVIERIVRSLNPQKGQHLLEIGPGLGALTVPVLQKCAHLTCIELDRDVIPLLQQQTAAIGQLDIISADALTIDLTSLNLGTPLRIYGNLPYNISTPLLFHFFTHIDGIGDMMFMLQKEVVERMAATHLHGDYGRLSVMVQYYCRVEHLFNVGSGAFKPAPKVESAIVRLVPHAARVLLPEQETCLAQIVSAAFSARRKALRNGLKGLLTVDEIHGAGIDDGLRPENISVANYVKLALMLHGLQTDLAKRSD